MKVGESYYFIVHAYHHFIAEVAEILGTQRVVTKNKIRVYSCRRGWTEFFRDGLKDDTTYTHFPDGGEFTYLTADPWKHPIPKRPNK